MTAKAMICTCVVICAFTLSFGGCSSDDPMPAPSNSVAALSEIINLQHPVKTVRWEVFGTPEYTGGIPVSTDYVTLIAELEPVQDWPIAGSEPTGKMFIVPKAARPWLSGSFRNLMKKNENTGADLSSQSNCRKYSTTIKKSGRPVDGFVCSNAGRFLMYLTLSSAS